jgi:hypothetical protein
MPFTVKSSEAAARFACTARAVRYMCQRGDLNATKGPGGHWLIDDRQVRGGIPKTYRPDENAFRKPEVQAARRAAIDHALKREAELLDVDGYVSHQVESPAATVAAPARLEEQPIKPDQHQPDDWPSWAGRKPTEYSPTRERSRGRFR